MSDSILNINELTQNLQPYLRQIKDELIAFHTSDPSNANLLEYVHNELNSLGLHSRQIEQAGVAADLPGSPDCNRAIALRFELGQAHSSERYENRSYALDGLVESLTGLGMAQVLRVHSHELSTRPRLLFQVRDEEDAHNSKILIRQGMLQKVSAVFGMKLNPALPVESVGIKFGPLLASRHEFVLKLFAKKAGRTALQAGDNLIQNAAHLLIELPQATLRGVDPLTPVELAYSSIQGYASGSEVPEPVIIHGLIRTANESIHAQIPELFKKLIKEISGSHEMEYEFDCHESLPILLSDSRAASSLKQAARQVLGAAHVRQLEFPSSNLDGFAEYLRLVPGAVLEPGVNNLPAGAEVSLGARAEVLERLILQAIKMLALAVMHYSQK
ncbi:MAG: M20/M25/M40 family metallo-hydrolase [bacterium]